MKKTFTTIMVIALVLVGVLLFSACDELAGISVNGITLEDAKRIAAENAGIVVETANYSRAERETDNGTKYYDVEFTANGVKYEYDIAETSGSIILVEVNDEPVRSESTSVVAPLTETTYIGTEAAKTAALTHAAVAVADAIFTEAILDFDEGVVVYDVEFFAAGIEYDYEINATTGAVVKVEHDREQSTQAPADSATSALIGVDAAKAAALTHAGVAEADAVFTEAKLDVDRGIYVYEIEFLAAGYEYDYEINAASGAVIEVDRERA